MANGRPSGHLSGGKFTASHTTVIEAADAPARAAAQLECVSKVSLGPHQVAPQRAAGHQVH